MNPDLGRWRWANLVTTLLVGGCMTASPRGPDVTIMKIGTTYPSRGPACKLAFLNAAHLDILANGYEHLGLVGFSGRPEELALVADAVPAAVAAAACEMGADAVSLNAAAGSAVTQIVQFSIWHAPPDKSPAQPASPAGKGI